MKETSMNHPARRLSAVLLALALLTLPAAAHADPAPRLPGAADGWITCVLDLLGGLVDGLWTIGAASQTDDGTATLEPGDGATAVDLVGDGTESSLTTRTGLKPNLDPNGAV
jgi:hypothetical protein